MMAGELDPGDATVLAERGYEESSVAMVDTFHDGTRTEG